MPCTNVQVHKAGIDLYTFSITYTQVHHNHHRFMHFCTGCLTCETLPNRPVLSCQFCLLHRPPRGGHFEYHVTASSRQVPRPLLCVCLVLSGNLIPVGCCGRLSFYKGGTQLAPARSRGNIPKCEIQYMYLS